MTGHIMKKKETAEVRRTSCQHDENFSHDLYWEPRASL